MAETTYFEEPDVQVTSKRIVTPRGVYASSDVQSVTIEREKGLRKWLYRIVGILLLVALLADISYLWLNLIPVGYSVCLMGIAVFSNVVLMLFLPRVYEVKMRGTFGLVTFDCGDNGLYATRLKKALTALLAARKQQLETISGAANG